MCKHPHAELMMQYAQDAMETDRPWERWELNCDGDWAPLDSSPRWLDTFSYRRNPRTITINGIEVPEPMREAPEPDSTFWIVVCMLSGGVRDHYWIGDTVDHRFLRRGLCHATREAAEAYAKALVAASGGKWEE